MAMPERSECVFDPARTSLMTAALEAALLTIKPSRTDTAKRAGVGMGARMDRGPAGLSARGRFPDIYVIEGLPR
jgi:hypothetical protein